MLTTVRYPCRVEAIPAGKRSVETFFVLRNLRVDIPLIEQDIIHLAMKHVSSPASRFERTTNYLCLDGYSGLFLRLPTRDGDNEVWELSGEMVDRLALNPVLRLEDSISVDGNPVDIEYYRPLQDAVAQLPAVRAIVRDYEVEAAAALTGSLRRCVMARDGSLFVPASELIWSLSCGPKGRVAQAPQFAHADDEVGKRWAYRADGLEQAIADAAARGFATDRGQLDRRDIVEVYRPDVLRFEPRRAHIVAAVHDMLDSFHAQLNQLPLREITAWANCRNAFNLWRRQADAPLVDLATFVAPSFEVLKDNRRMPPLVRREISEALAEISNAPEISADFEGIGAPSI